MNALLVVLIAIHVAAFDCEVLATYTGDRDSLLRESATLPGHPIGTDADRAKALEQKRVALEENAREYLRYTLLERNPPACAVDDPFVTVLNALSSLLNQSSPFQDFAALISSDPANAFSLLEVDRIASISPTTAEMLEERFGHSFFEFIWSYTEDQLASDPESAMDALLAIEEASDGWYAEHTTVRLYEVLRTRHEDVSRCPKLPSEHVERISELLSGEYHSLSKADLEGLRSSYAQFESSQSAAQMVAIVDPLLADSSRYDDRESP